MRSLLRLCLYSYSSFRAGLDWMRSSKIEVSLLHNGTNFLLIRPPQRKRVSGVRQTADGGRRMANGIVGRPSIHTRTRLHIHASTRPCMEADVAQVRRPASGVLSINLLGSGVGTWRRISGLGDAFVARGSWLFRLQSQ